MAHEALADTRVITVNGARQVGKSTLVKALLRSYPDSIQRSLDVATERQAALSDPTRFVRHDGLLAIDEVQRVPELVLSIKAAVDADPRPGQFLLTGSARLLGLRKLPDALVGRMETIELWPFSQGEIDRRDERFIDRVFNDEWAAALPGGHSLGAESRDGYIERALGGGFPEGLRRTPGRRAKFFDAYVDDLIDRDVTQLVEIERRSELRRLLRLLGGSMVQPLNVERIASEVGLPATTTERYISLLEEVFLIKRVDGWHRRLPAGRCGCERWSSSILGWPRTCAVSPRPGCGVTIRWSGHSSRTSSSENSRDSSHGHRYVPNTSTTERRNTSRSTRCSKPPTAALSASRSRLPKQFIAATSLVFAICSRGWATASTSGSSFMPERRSPRSVNA